MIHLGPLDWGLCVLYLTVVVVLALLSTRGQTGNEDYFVGSRRMNWTAVGVSLFATSFSSISFLGLPQRGAYQDLSFYVTILFIPLVITPVLWWVFVPVFVRMRVSSGYEYLGLRFGQPVRQFGSILYVIYALGWMGAMLHAVALTLQVVLGLDTAGYYWALIGVGVFATLYTALGGLKAVIYTDVAQAIVLAGVMILIFILAIGQIEGGWNRFWEIAKHHDKLRLIYLSPTAADNFTDPRSLCTAAAFGLFMYLPGYAVSQNMIQRYVCAGSLAAGRGVVALSALMNTVLGLLFLLVGTALFSFYNQGPETSLPQPGGLISSEDQILPHFVATQLSGFGLTGLLVAGLFAAAMSTVDSGINGVASVVVFDWLQGREMPLRKSRLLTLALGLLVVGAGLLAPMLGDTVIGIINTVAGTTLGMLLAVYLLGLLVPWTNGPGTLLGLASGLISLGLVWSFTEVPKWWYGAFAMGPVLVVGTVASKWFPRPAPAVLQRTLLKSILRSSNDDRDGVGNLP